MDINTEQRYSWTEYFFNLANQVSLRSTCIRRKVGAIAVTPYNHIIATGYNGQLPKYKHCTPETCYRTVNNIPSGQQLDKCYAIHAEQNIVAQLGNRLRDCTIYVTNQPCITCFKLLISSGVVCIRWQFPYQDEMAMDMLKQTGEVIKSNIGFYEWCKEEEMPF